jgi:hypothetical protein
MSLLVLLLLLSTSTAAAVTYGGRIEKLLLLLIAHRLPFTCSIDKSLLDAAVVVVPELLCRSACFYMP